MHITIQQHIKSLQQLFWLFDALNTLLNQTKPALSFRLNSYFRYHVVMICFIRAKRYFASKGEICLRILRKTAHPGYR
jgi:hypothetical protein